MNITCFKDLAETAKLTEKKAVFAVVEAHDEHTIEAVVRAKNDGIMTPVLIGCAEKICQLLINCGSNPADFEIADSVCSQRSLELAVEMISSGETTAIMKGNIESAGFLKSLIIKENGLLTGGLLSLVGLFELPRYHKILAVSDMVMNIYPDLKDKKSIIENAVGMLNAIGVAHPKVAVLSAIEKLNDKMPETYEADALKKMNQDGVIENCVIEGPISFDLATCAEAARIKGYKSPVAGDADLLVVPDIVSGNMLVKCMTGMAGARTAGVVLGAKIPVVLTSRSAEMSDKYYSIALASVAATVHEVFV